MTKTAKKAERFFKQRGVEAKRRLKIMNDKREATDSFAYWAEWNAMEYIRWEITLGFWDLLLGSLRKLVVAGKTDAEIVQWVSDVRDQFVEDVLRARQHHSTNSLANMIEAEKVDVSRQMVDGLAGDSLVYLLSMLKKD